MGANTVESITENLLPSPPLPPNQGVKNWRGWGLLLNVLVAVVALTGVGCLQWLGMQRPQKSLANQQLAIQQEARRLETIKHLPSLGFDNLIANWIFLNFLQYFGDDARKTTGFSLGAEYFDIITRRDPRFADIYPFLSSTISFYLANPRLAVEYMQRGTKVLNPQIHPRAFLVWRFKALDELLLLGDIKGAIHSLEMAAQWVKGTPYEEYAKFYQQTADFLKKDPDSTLVRFMAWNDVYYQSTDKKIKERAKQEILKLGAEERRDENGEIFFVFPQSQNQNKTR